MGKGGEGATLNAQYKSGEGREKRKKVEGLIRALVGGVLQRKGTSVPQEGGEGFGESLEGGGGRRD